MPERPWWQTAVIYQIYPRSFADANGDGVGDLAGIRSRLDYLVDLGVGAIWISPFYPSPMADFGYDVADYTDVDPLFGDLHTFDALLAGAHAKGLRVIVDWVPNHTSSTHPWFVESRSSRDANKRSWYVWRDGPVDGGAPNNWRSVFGGSAWTWDETSGQFYLHSFLPAQPDLNWRNPDVVNAMHATLRFWLERGVDGFRIDVADRIMKDPEFRDNPVASGAHTAFKSLGEFDRLEELHSKAHHDVHTRFAQLREIVDGYPGDRVLIGEIHEWDWDVWASYYGYRLPELHMPFNFSMLYADWDAGTFRELVAAVERVTRGRGWPNYVLGNHDELRLVQRFGAPAARVAAVMLLTLRGTPTVYYGDELGMMQAHVPPHDQQDPWGRRVPGLGRDGARTPMQWRPGHAAGFSTSEPWLAVVDPDQRHNVEAQDRDPTSLLSLYRRLLALRRSRSELCVGDYEPLDGPDGVFMYRRLAASSACVVILNFSQRPVEVPVPAGELLLRSSDGAEGSVDDRVTLDGLEGAVVGLV